MQVIHQYITDDGYFKLFKIDDFKMTYKELFDDISQYVYKSDGFSINYRHSGLFSLDEKKIGKPLCTSWKYTPIRYIYQQFTPLLVKLLNIVQRVTSKSIFHNEYIFKDAIVNIYGEGDFIAYHKDYHVGAKQPCSLVCSFECDEKEEHIMEFYRTIGEPWSTKKDRGEGREEVTISLPDKSFGLMVGMQNKYVHAIQPGKKRISVVFR